MNITFIRSIEVDTFFKQYTGLCRKSLAVKLVKAEESKANKGNAHQIKNFG
jgi:hypothetical protein